MTYATIGTQFFPLAHYLVALLFLFIVLPKFLFSATYEGWTDRWLAAYIKMVFFLIIIGYVLVITKLYEVLSLSVLFIVIIGYRFIKREQGKRTGTLNGHLIKRVFNLLDGLFKFRISDIKTFIIRGGTRMKSSLQQNFSWSLLLEGLTLAIIIGGSAYLRFYDAFAHAAPPMADSYVTLAWMKYIDARELFHDGIYPQGFHIYLATIFKFAAVDALYILRYTGPLNAVLFTLGLYMVIRKLTKSGFGSLAAALIFGLYWAVPSLSPMEIDRQAATNSQEFAFIFIFPAIYFLMKYVLNKHKEDLKVGLVCTAIIGLVHSLAFALAGLLIGVLIVSALLVTKQNLKPAIHVTIGAIIAVVFSLVPLGAGYLLGKDFHSSSAEYLVDRKEAVFTYPDLTYVDTIALGFCLLLFLCIFVKKNSAKDRLIALFTVVAGLSVFTLYYAGGAWTGSTLIANRSHELWGLLMPFCVGISISFLVKWVKEKWEYFLYVPLILLIVFSLVLYKPMPIIPYKLEHSENIEQYLKIQDDYLPKTWMIVSQSEGYSVSLGTGFHMHLGDFLQNYRPDGKALTRRDDGTIDTNLSPHIFIFMEKKLFQVSESNSVYELLKPEYERKVTEYKQLSEWMKVHEQSGFEVETYFENENIRVYHLQTSEEDSLLIKNMWGH